MVLIPQPNPFYTSQFYQSVLTTKRIPGYFTLIKKRFYFIHMNVLPANMYAHCIHAEPRESREGVRYAGTGVTDSW